MKIKTRKYIFIVTGSLFSVIVFILWTVWSFHNTYAIRTSSDARPAEVMFLHLPESASQVGYWRDGCNYWADFNISESEFRQLFRQHELTEITKTNIIDALSFGNKAVFPTDTYEPNVEITNGLKFLERWDNGGGYEIFYDRANTRAYYRFNKR